MKEIEGEVRIWNNLGTEPIPEGYNVVLLDDIAMKTDITGTNSGTNTGDETHAGLLTKLGIPGPYADQTAAIAAGVPNKSIYYQTTTLKLFVVDSGD